MSDRRIKHIAVNGRAPNPTREQLAVLGAIAKQKRGTYIDVKLIAHECGISLDCARTRLSRMQEQGLIRKGGGWEIAK